MKIIGAAENGQLLVAMGKIELVNILGFTYEHEIREKLKADLVPGLTVDVSKIYKSTKAIVTLAGSIDYQAREIRSAIDSVIGGARTISESVSMPEDPPKP